MFDGVIVEFTIKSVDEGCLIFGLLFTLVFCVIILLIINLNFVITWIRQVMPKGIEIKGFFVQKN